MNQEFTFHPTMLLNELPKSSFEYRFWSKVDFSGGVNACWLWKAARIPAGYGKIYYKGKQTYAHRAIYEHRYGALAPHTVICHKCDNPPCVNPKHLFAGTTLDNVRDKIRKNRDNRGLKNGMAKDKDDIVLKAIELYKQGKSVAIISKEIGKAETTVWQWVSGKRRVDVGGNKSLLRAPNGEHHPQARLNAESVRVIRVRHAQDLGIDIANDLGVSDETVYSVIRGKSWKNVK